MSKITPETQPPNDMPTTDAMITMPTRVAASLAGIDLPHDDGIARHDAALKQAEHAQRST